MENIRMEVGQRPQVLIRSVGGDLRLVGRPGSLLESQGASRGDVSAGQEGERVVLNARSGCLLYVPEGASVEVGSVGGDGRVTGLRGDLTIDYVAGDLTLRRVRRTAIRRVDGDLQARELVGELDVTSIGGGAQVDDVRGGTRLEAVGGDVALRGVEGEVHFFAHGDGVVTLAPQAGETSSVEAGGDLTVRLPNEASVRLRLQAGGDLDLALPGTPEHDGDATVVTLGTGEANLSFKAGGDLRVRQGGGRGDSTVGPDWQEDLEARVRAQVEAALSGVDAAWQTQDMGLGVAERVREQVRRSMERAGRRAGHARRGMDTPPAPAETSAVGSDERMLILRMLESGKINVDQAEKLFEALEGKA
jgi:hypothetical protein